MRIVSSGMDYEATQLCGYAILIVSALLVGIAFYAIVVSKIMPRTGESVLDTIAEDTYYCMLVPLTIPVTVIAVYWNWVSMKFFRHN